MEQDCRYLLVGNPTSGSGQGAHFIDEALELMRARCLYVDFLQTEPEGRTVAVLEQRLLDTEYDVVIALGGDGTFAEVAKGLLADGRDIPMGFFPFGTANDQGKSFGIRVGVDSLAYNLDIIEAGFVRKIDVGVVERIAESGEVSASEHVFHSVGWGMQPDILAVRNEERKVVEEIPWVKVFYRDYAVYAGAAFDRYIASWVEPTKFTASVVADGEMLELEGLTDLVVNATAVYGGIFVLDRTSEPDDGLFEMLPIHGRRDWAVSALRTLRPVTVLERQIGIEPQIRDTMRRLSQFEARFTRDGRENVRSQVDGEQWVSGKHFRLRVMKQALSLLVPVEFVPNWKEPEGLEPAL